jgi:hypothetical protein
VRGICERIERDHQIAGEAGAQIARVADAIGQLQRDIGLADVELRGVRDGRTVVADVADVVVILVVLIRVERVRAVVARVRDAVSVEIVGIRIGHRRALPTSGNCGDDEPETHPTSLA